MKMRSQYTCPLDDDTRYNKRKMEAAHNMAAQ